LAVLNENSYHLGNVLKERTMSRLIRPHLPTLKKTASYYLLHITVAALVAYAVTGNLWMAFTLSLIEPSVQAVAFFFHEKAWNRVARADAAEPAPATA
jgi:uncharacterized membrane protein